MMNFFRQTKKRTLFLWTLLLSIALLSAQGIKLHVHSLDHNQEYDHISIESLVDHSKISKVHLSTDVTHEDHHDGITSELDVSYYGFMKKVSNSVLTLVFFFILFTLFFISSYRQIFYRRRNNIAMLPWRYINSPPLRAPPL